MIKLSSGPCQKYPGWSVKDYQTELLGRSHRSEEALKLIQECLSLHRDVLSIPDDYAVAIVPGSSTGAMESALWNLIGQNPVTSWNFGVFSGLWQKDLNHLVPDLHTGITADFGKLPPLYDTGQDLVLTWTETSTGVSIPHADWIEDNPNRLIFCDVAAAAFCAPIPIQKIDVIAFSWQKGLGGEGAHGMLLLSPRALNRLKNYMPAWPIPRLFSLRLQDGSPNLKLLFEGSTPNTPSLLCVQDFVQALQWAKNEGGMEFLHNRTLLNYNTLQNLVGNQHDWSFFAEPFIRSLSPIVLVHKNHNTWPFYEETTKKLADHGIYDVKNHAFSVPALRFWTGPTIQHKDLEKAFAYVLSTSH